MYVYQKSCQDFNRCGLLVGFAAVSTQFEVIMLTRRSLLVTAAAGFSALASAPLLAQAYPNRPIKLVVPFPAGGANDTIGRLVAQHLSSSLGQPVIIENQAGAGGTTGTKMVANAHPDGHALLLAAVSTLCIAPLLYPLDYDPAKAFAPVATLATEAQTLVVIPSVPAQSLQELVRYAKANPGMLNYGAATGIAPHLMMELLKSKAGIDIVHIPYRGGAPVISDLLGGQIHATINNKSVLLPLVKDGRLRALAVNSFNRWPELPDIPTLRESGFANIPSESWFGILAPSLTPAKVIEQLDGAIGEALKSPDIRAGFAKLGIDTKAGGPQQFAALLAEEIPRWAEIVRITGVKLP
jgi:tripartite-type tricarboxylate transporter receptor subunit TctC